MKKLKGRRKHERFIVKNRSTALVSPTTNLSYAVLDISVSGLSFSYAGWEKWPKRGIKLDILDREFFLEDIPASVIGDVQFDDGSKKLRRCGVKFTRLEKGQKARLRRYIASVALD
jgi:c-di-GMP-binding flagellar brake protein YcgR